MTFPGGVVRAHSHELYGPLAEHAVGELHVDTAVLGVDGLDGEFGASAYSDAEASVNASLARNAGRVVVVADSSKVGVAAFARICPLARVDVVVTDTGIDPEARAGLEAQGVCVYAV
jgi:DeoR family transcriptional regulator of aga operon